MLQTSFKNIKNFLKLLPSYVAQHNVVYVDRTYFVSVFWFFKCLKMYAWLATY